jgi:4-hydroxy-tetrahydrodipicolinate reductase
MKIMLLGYGKMGKTIESIAVEKGHIITHRITTENRQELNNYKAGQADVAIEFTSPESAVANLEFCLRNQLPVVCGTTGWLAHFDQISHRFATHGGALFYASNYSIGVNIFFELNRLLAQWMSIYPEYAPSITEIHHTEKKDAPSGTAITLAEGILSAYNQLHSWGLTPNVGNHQLPITALREPHVPGTHTITYQSPIDSIKITHIAHSREGFARGALQAAEWLIGKQGVFSMKDMLSSWTDKHIMQ